MRFSLRTLIIVMLLAGPACALGYREWRRYQAAQQLNAEMTEAHKLLRRLSVPRRSQLLLTRDPAPPDAITVPGANEKEAAILEAPSVGEQSAVTSEPPNFPTSLRGSFGTRRRAYSAESNHGRVSSPE